MTIPPLGQPAKIQVSANFGGKAAKCAPLYGTVLISHTSRLFRVAKIREYAREMDDLSMAVHKAIQYCIDHDHLRVFLILNQAEVAAMSLLEGSWEEYADSMDQELERLKESEKKLKESEKALKKEVLEKDAELERVSREKDTELKRISSEKDARIKELEALLASKQ